MKVLDFVAKAVPAVIVALAGAPDWAITLVIFLAYGPSTILWADRVGKRVGDWTYAKTCDRFNVPEHARRRRP